MTKTRKIRSMAAVALAVALVVGCGTEPAKKDRSIAVEHPWIRMPAVAGEPAAGYFRLTGGAEGTTLVSVSSPLVKKIELHESMTGGGAASMRKLKDVGFAYDGTIDFKPGGRHAMILGVAETVKPGGTLPLTFAFDNAPPLTVNAEVRSASGEAAHSGH